MIIGLSKNIVLGYSKVGFDVGFYWFDWSRLHKKKENIGIVIMFYFIR